MPRILYSGTKNASSWAFRAWLALKEANAEFEEIVVDIRPPQRFSNLKKIAEFSPPGAVPVLVDGATVIFDSLAIMEYANELCDGALLPQEVLTRARARSFVSWQHAGLSSICPRLSFESFFYPDKRAMSLDERHQATGIFSVWEQQLESSGGPYLFGALSLADLAMLPSALRLTSHMEDLKQWPGVSAWTAALLSRSTVKEWLLDAKQQPVVPLGDYMP